MASVGGVTDLVKLANARDHARSGAGRLVRLSAGISLREMARVIGVDASALLRWERGEQRPTGAPAARWVEELHRLAEREQPRRKAPGRRSPGLAGQEGERGTEQHGHLTE
jgi:transcriptional regulator with XRE-family HTH domain